MARMIDGKYYYTALEVCNKVGISKSTLWRWSKKDPSLESRFRDRNGWRLWSEDEIEALSSKFNVLLPLNG